MLHAPATESKERSESGGMAVRPKPSETLHSWYAGPGRTAVSIHEGNGTAVSGSRFGAASLSRNWAGLQKTIGNQAVLRRLSRSAPAIQTKLTVNQPGDEYEQEADRVAEQVMRMPDSAVAPRLSFTSGKNLGLHRKCAECEEEEKLQRKEAVPTPTFAPSIVHEALDSPSQPLEAATRAYFEPRFGYDLGAVRIHADARAAESSQALGAQAYTVGSHIVFARGQYTPQSDSGRRLVAHELVHVGQQRGARGVPAASSDIGLQRQGTPQTQPQPPAGGQGQTPDEPTPWLTLQAQPFFQYQRIYTIPKPPPWLLGGQLAANVQFHSGDTGLELAILGQYGQIFKWDSTATTGGEQLQVGVQPSYVFFNAKVIGNRGTQIAAIGQGTYGYTWSKDPTVKGQQFSLLGGAQITQDIAQLGPFKVQGVGSLAGGGVWAKGPLDTGFSGAGAWQVQVGVQIAWDAVKRKRPTPPPENIQTPVPHEELAPEKKKPEPKKSEDEQKQEQKKKDAEEEAKKKVAQEPNTLTPLPRPALPQDLKIFFLKDKPLDGLPADKDVLNNEMGGDDLAAAKTLVQAALAADPSLKVSISGYASIEAPNPKYNCDLGFRRAEWIRRQLGIPPDRVADPPDKAPEICADHAEVISFGSNEAGNTKIEAERRRDRFAIVHFHRS